MEDIPGYHLTRKFISDIIEMNPKNLGLIPTDKIDRTLCMDAFKRDGTTFRYIYENSMKWLSDASKLKLNPQIPRKLAEDKKPVTDWQLATFQTDYDPYKNPWMV